MQDLIEFYAASRLSPSELKLSQFPRPVSPIGALAGTVNYAQLSGEHDVEEPEDMDITEMTLPSDISPELSPRANVPEPRVSDWERVWGVEKPANNHTHKNELASSEESTVQEVQASAPRESSRSLLPQMSRHMRSCDRWNLAVRRRPPQPYNLNTIRLPDKRALLSQCIDCAVECADIVVSTLPWAIRAPARETGTSFFHCVCVFMKLNFLSLKTIIKSNFSNVPIDSKEVGVKEVGEDFSCFRVTLSLSMYTEALLASPLIISSLQSIHFHKVRPINTREGLQQS